MRTKELLSDLRARIQAQHDEDWRAFKCLERSLSASADESESDPPTETTVTSEPDSATLIGAVEQLFRANPNIHWSVPMIEDHMRRDGFVFEAIIPGPSLNKAVNRLTERGIVSLFKRGRGRKPNIYKARLAGNLDALRGRLVAIPEPDPQIISNGKVEDGRAEEAEPISQ